MPQSALLYFLGSYRLKKKCANHTHLNNTTLVSFDRIMCISLKPHCTTDTEHSIIFHDFLLFFPVIPSQHPHALANH